LAADNVAIISILTPLLAIDNDKLASPDGGYIEEKK
jgi:hypothetical protein